MLKFTSKIYFKFKFSFFFKKEKKATLFLMLGSYVVLFSSVFLEN